MRDVREEPGVQSRVDEAYRRWARATEAWDAVVWSIARDPFGAGPSLTESGTVRIMVFDGARSIGMPSVKAVYVIEPAAIIVREVVFTEAAHLYAGNA